MKLSRLKKQISLDQTPKLASDQRGITGLETAIVLIAFVVASSVFAFAALSTGLFSSDKAKETHTAGLAESRGTLEFKGSVVAKVSGTIGATGVVTSIAFQISNAAAGEAVDMTPGNTIITYSDKTQTVNLNSSTEFSASNIAAFEDTDSLLEIGELFQITLLDLTSNLATDLGANTDFTIEMIPSGGAVLFIGRRTPVSLEASNTLD